MLHSPEEMRALGARIAQALEPCMVLGLVGKVGAGKTHLVQGILQGLGVADHGASPTFSLVHEHDDGRVPVAHFDFYRLRSPQEAHSIDWEGYLASPRVLLVEWADQFEGELMPEGCGWLIFKHLGENQRSLQLILPETN